MEKQLKRSEVPEALKWDLTLLYESDEAMEQALAKTQQKASELAKTAGHFASDGQTFLRNLNENKAIDEELEREFVYGMLRRDSDTTDSTAVTLYGQVVNAATTIEAELAFIQPELTAIDDADFAKLMQSEPGLAEYQYEMTKLRRQKKHVLSKAEETLLGHLNKSLDSAEEIYNTLNDADLKFGKVHDENGQLVELTHGNRSQFNESQNRSVRKEAVLAYEKPYHELRNTFAQTLNSFIGTENALARIRHYPSARAAALGANNIPESVYDTLVATVNQHLDLVYRWYELKKRVLGLDKMYKYDVNVPLAGEDMLKTTFEQGKQLTWDALQVMGPEYLKGLKNEFEHRWIDAAENLGKRSGGYQVGVYTANPFILLNWTDKLYSTFVLAHESGHAMHSWFAQQAQPSEYADAPIFLAEVASTFNENILTDYLLEKYQDDPKKLIFILEQYITGFIGTIYRQTQFAEFEDAAYKAEQKGQTLTADYLDQLSGKLVNKYYGPAVEETGTRTQSWAYVPHFYMNYYVYQYATSWAVSTALSEAVWQHEPGALERYLDLLRAGGSDDPVTLLKHAGVDVTDSRYLERAFALFEKRLNQIEKLL